MFPRSPFSCPACWAYKKYRKYRKYRKDIMNVHRVRKAKALYDQEKFHIFLEVEKNRWLEIESLAGISYDSIRAFLKMEKDTGIRAVGFTDTSFQVGTIKDWDDAGVIRKI
jgi:hypothetical protein